MLSICFVNNLSIDGFADSDDEELRDLKKLTRSQTNQ